MSIFLPGSSVTLKFMLSSQLVLENCRKAQCIWVTPFSLARKEPRNLINLRKGFNKGLKAGRANSYHEQAKSL